MLKRYAWIVYFAILVLAPLSVFIALEWLPWPQWPVLALVTIVVMGSLGEASRLALCDSTIGPLRRRET